MQEGNDWIIEFLAKAQKGIKKIVIDGAGSQQILADQLKEEKIKRVHLPTVAEVIKANAAFMKNLYDDRLRHMEQPSMDQVTTNCEKRAVGSKGGFGFKEIRANDDISMLDASMLAAWAVEEFKEPRKQRVWY